MRVCVPPPPPPPPPTSTDRLPTTILGTTPGRLNITPSSPFQFHSTFAPAAIPPYCSSICPAVEEEEVSIRKIFFLPPPPSPFHGPPFSCRCLAGEMEKHSFDSGYPFPPWYILDLGVLVVIANLSLRESIWHAVPSTTVRFSISEQRISHHARFKVRFQSKLSKSFLFKIVLPLVVCNRITNKVRIGPLFSYYYNNYYCYFPPRQPLILYPGKFLAKQLFRFQKGNCVAIFP